MDLETAELTYTQRLDLLRKAKMEANEAKQALTGYLNADDLAIILPPEDRRKVTEAISGSGQKITDVLLDGVEMVSNHPNGAFYGPRAAGENFSRLLRAHPPYVDPRASLAGAYMANFNSYRKGGWKPEFDYSWLHEDQRRYGLITGIGAAQHFCQDLAIGLESGWDGILAKIARGRQVHPESDAFYDGLEAVARGIQDWIARTAEHARNLADTEQRPDFRRNLLEMADINQRLVTEPPRTFREACQWIVWFQMAARMYNGSGSLGKLDLLLEPFYQRDVEAGILDDEEATFHLACLLLRDTAYIQVGGPDGDRKDVTNPVSYLILEAAHRLKIPCNVGVSVGEDVDRGLLRRGVEIMLEDKLGVPKFLGIDSFVQGYMRNGYPFEVASKRAYAGCHWCAMPGREYTLNDCVKINLGAVFVAAWGDLCALPELERSVAELWRLFEGHLERAVAVIAEGLDIQVEHMHEVFPELVLDLLCHGPIEQGIDASHGGVEYMNLCVDAAALATVADSFAALEQRVEREGRVTWDELRAHLDADWAGTEGERARLMMRSIPRYGTGGAPADDWARRVSGLFTSLVKAGPTPAGHNMIPGIFSWANTIEMGRGLPATPNGRHAGAPISHGANPDPGFRHDGAPTALAVAIAGVQPGWGNSAPMQIEVDLGTATDRDAVAHVMHLIETHCRLGGTQINMNVVDKDKILAAHEDPSLYPDLIVRVTGFSAYFNRLSPEFRQLVVNRIITEN
ncbi:MAG: pyruvate formate lyase family protein [Anaerolineae bacterium]